MRTAEELRNELRGMDRRSYPAYKALAGTWQFEKYRLTIDHVQGDPFASPSSLHVELSHRQARIPERYYENPYAKTALRDYIVREAGRQFEKCNFKARGSGKSGLMSISRCGQEVLERSACEIDGEGIILRFHVGFPAFGRTIQAKELEKILFDFLPECIENAMCWRRLDHRAVEQAVWLAEDQEALRKILVERQWVAFAANGSVLPRKSGVSELPMTGSVPFTAPDSMTETVELPHRGKVTGMAVPEGITLIVGGGYHGKSTFLEALQNGVYNHIGGDGRELVITDNTAVKLRAEDGRSVRNVDISMFINDLPNGRDTTCFSTMDASGSTSQAAGVVESMEAGTRLLLIDEDTSATNFMVPGRKSRLRHLSSGCAHFMSRRVYRQFLLPEAQAHSFMKQTELSRWIAIMWWISRKKSATSVDKMPVDSMLWSRCRPQLLRCRYLTEKVRQPVINGK